MNIILEQIHNLWSMILESVFASPFLFCFVYYYSYYYCLLFCVYSIRLFFPIFSFSFFPRFFTWMVLNWFHSLSDYNELIVFVFWLCLHPWLWFSLCVLFLFFLFFSFLFYLVLKYEIEWNFFYLLNKCDVIVIWLDDVRQTRRSRSRRRGEGIARFFGDS